MSELELRQWAFDRTNMMSSMGERIAEADKLMAWLGKAKGPMEDWFASIDRYSDGEASRLGTPFRHD